MLDLKYLNRITDTSLKDFILESIKNHKEEDTEQKIKDADGVAEWLLFLLEDDKIVSAGSNAYFVELLITAAYIHNIDYTYGEDDWTNIFNPRKKTQDVANKFGIIGNTIDAIYQAIEGQLGKDNPNKLLHPNPNSPTAHFALACSIYYKKIKM